jgi:hypothetical protein
VASNEIDADAVLISARILRALLKQNGLAKVRTRNILFTPFSSHVFRIIDERLGWLPSGLNTIQLEGASVPEMAHSIR